MLSTENWMYFQEKKHISSSLQSIWTWTVFSYQTQDMTMNRVSDSVVLVQRAPCSSLDLMFRRKPRHDIIFGIPYYSRNFVCFFGQFCLGRCSLSNQSNVDFDYVSQNDNLHNRKATEHGENDERPNQDLNLLITPIS